MIECTIGDWGRNHLIINIYSQEHVNVIFFNVSQITLETAVWVTYDYFHFLKWGGYSPFTHPKDH